MTGSGCFGSRQLPTGRLSAVVWDRDYFCPCFRSHRLQASRPPSPSASLPDPPIPSLPPRTGSCCLPPSLCRSLPLTPCPSLLASASARSLHQPLNVSPRPLLVEKSPPALRLPRRGDTGPGADLPSPSPSPRQRIRVRRLGSPGDSDVTIAATRIGFRLGLGRSNPQSIKYKIHAGILVR